MGVKKKENERSRLGQAKEGLKQVGCLLERTSTERDKHLFFVDKEEAKKELDSFLKRRGEERIGFFADKE